METIKRDYYLNQLINKRGNGLVKVITGVRRCGKSFLLFNLYRDYLLSSGVEEDDIITLSLDENRNIQYRDVDKLSEFIYSKIKDEKMHYLLLDEAQFAIKGEELKANEPIRLYGLLNELMHKGNIDIYITGSNSRFLSSDILTEFRGRSDNVNVHPLSFSEFMSAYEGNEVTGYQEYSVYGGLPMILQRKSPQEKSNYLKSLFDTVYIRDIIERHGLREDALVINTLTDILASSIGSLSNPSKLAKTFKSNQIKADDKTIASYIKYLEDSFLIHEVKRYDVKGKKYISTPNKYYFEDIGLRNARLNFRQLEPTHAMENIIYNELLIRGFDVDVGQVNQYSRDADKKQVVKKLEVDFVCNLGDVRYYIQSAFAIPNQDKMRQEQLSLDKINDNFKKILVVGDPLTPTHYDEKGYLITNIYDFLLKKDILGL